MKVPFIDLALQYRNLKAEIDKGIQELCSQCSFILGPQVKEFEEGFASFVSSKHCQGVASGTDALELAFRALGIGPGDEVIIPANTFVATAIGVMQAGATPVMIDIDPSSYLIDYEKLEDACSARTKAICVVHLYGRSCDMDTIMSFAESRSIAVIEDAAQSHGATWKGKPTGSFGDIGCFSFYPGKNLGAYGDGGATVTDSDLLDHKLRALRNYGSQIKYEHPEVGTNSRLDSMQAVVLNVKLKHLAQWNQNRWNAAKRYCDNLKPLADQGLVQLPELATSAEHVFHLFVIQVGDRESLMAHLADSNVQSGIHYPKPIHLQGGYADLGYSKGDFPVTEAASERIMSLPMFPEITSEQVDYVCEVVSDQLASLDKASQF